MGAYKYIQESMQKGASERSTEYKTRVISMRREPTVLRLDKPTNVARARTLGYKAKQGFAVARVKVARGTGLHIRPKHRRKPKNMGTARLSRIKSKQVIAEERAQRRFQNMEVLNSYWIADDGRHLWFEVIMVDPHHPVIANDPQVSWTKNAKHRANRGKTSAAQRNRGLHNKGWGAERVRPSTRSHNRKTYSSTPRK